MFEKPMKTAKKAPQSQKKLYNICAAVPEGERRETGTKQNEKMRKRIAA
ncbi:hypothetical protein [Gemmiger sp. An50]|nr:hypothetical protein [Gemmiger sp. An50]